MGELFQRGEFDVRRAFERQKKSLLCTKPAPSRCSCSRVASTSVCKQPKRAFHRARSRIRSSESLNSVGNKKTVKESLNSAAHKNEKDHE